MDSMVFGKEVRKFLKKVGITSQREIEVAVNKAIANGDLAGDEVLKAHMVLSIDAVGLKFTVDDDIHLT